MMKLARSQKGFTFIEMMVSIAILAGGVILIYQAFFTCLDYLDHLKIRLYANIFLEHRIAQVQYDFQMKGNIPQIPKEDDLVIVNNNPIHFYYDMKVIPLEKTNLAYQVNLAIAWQQRGKVSTLKRSAYIARF